MRDAKKETSPRWKNIKKGDFLFKLERVIGTDRFQKGIHILPVWSKHVVEDSTRAFYVIDGKKLRKENEGNNGFDGTYVFSGDEVRGHIAPSEATDPSIASVFSNKLAVIDKASSTYYRIREIKDMDKAFIVASKLLDLMHEIDSTVSSENEASDSE